MHVGRKLTHKGRIHAVTRKGCRFECKNANNLRIWVESKYLKGGEGREVTLSDKMLKRLSNLGHKDVESCFELVRYEDFFVCRDLETSVDVKLTADEFSWCG